MTGITEHHVQFFTAVCKDWVPLLSDEKAKDIIIDDLRFRIKKGQVKICCFVIMPNHIHIIWRIGKEFKREEVQRDFLKFTAKAILKYLKTEDVEWYGQLLVSARDRRHQVWKRDSMSIDLFSEKFFNQKLEYIHANPCQPKLNLAASPFHYKYSNSHAGTWRSYSVRWLSSSSYSRLIHTSVDFSIYGLLRALKPISTCRSLGKLMQ